MSSIRLAACLLAAAVVVGACGDDDDASPVTVDPETTTTAPTTTDPTPTTENPEAAVEQAFYDQWDAFVEILEDPDPANPLIDEHFTGKAREALLDTISSDIENGYVTRRPEDPDHFKPSIESIEFLDDATAVVVECTVDGLVVLDKETGEVINDNVATYRLENEFVLTGGSWKISTTDSIDREDGAVACA